MLGKLPRYPSGIQGIEEKAGGFYGLTVLAAGPKAGKSLVALRSCVNTAAMGKGFKVIHVDFELDNYTFSERLMKAYGAHDLEELGECAPYLAERLAIIEGCSSEVREISKVVSEAICDPLDSRVLICIDSASRMAKRMQADGILGFFAAQQAITDWARNCVTLTNGRIGVILVFETNRAGQVKGQDPEYTGDCVLTMNKPDEMARPGEVDLFLISRATAAGGLGRYQINMDCLTMDYLGEST